MLKKRKGPDQGRWAISLRAAVGNITGSGCELLVVQDAAGCAPR